MLNVNIGISSSSVPGSQRLLAEARGYVLMQEEGKAKQRYVEAIEKAKAELDRNHSIQGKKAFDELRTEHFNFLNKLKQAELAQEKDKLVNYLFEKALSRLSSLEVQDKPSLFLVYAHENKAYGKSEASTSKYLIEKLSQIQVVLYSDQTPIGQPYSSAMGEVKKDSKLEDILTNQLCLLPGQLHRDVKPVDKVVVCCSEVLGSYLKWPEYDDFYQKLREAYGKDREAYLKGGEQGNACAIREVIKEFSQEEKYKARFHHVLTEMAFLQIRAEQSKDGHGIIPVPLTRNSHDACLSGFIASTAVRMEDIPRFEEQTEVDQEGYPNQSRQWVLFKLIERLLVSSDEAKTFLDKFWQGYSDCISWLKEASNLDEFEFIKRVDDIFDEIERVLHKQLASTVQQVYPAWQQVNTRLLDQSRDLAQIQTGVDSLVARLLGNLQENIQKLRLSYLEGLEKDREIKDALANYVSLEGMPLHDSIRFDLEGKVRDFLNSDKRILLLLGEAGSGKSTFNRYLAVSLWETYTQADMVEDMPIPVFIVLSSLLGPDRNLVNAFFEKQGFSKEQIKELQSKHRFVLILDGFDEIEHRQQVFYQDNELDDWKDAKIIISSRPEYLGPNYQYKFHPSGERTTLQEYRLAPFSDETIQQYIDRYSETHPHAVWNAERYKKALSEPSLKELVSNPFLLKITLSVLPELSERHKLENQRVTRIAIYDQFVKSWFDRSQQRLNQILEVGSKERKEFQDLEREGFADFGVDFSKELALKMYQAGEVITPYQAVSYAKWKKNNSATEGDWRRRLLGDEETSTVLMRLNAPLICQDRPNNLGKEYRFIHRSLRDYFVARVIWEELRSLPKVKHSDLSNESSILRNDIRLLWRNIDYLKELRPSLLFNELNIAKDPAVQSFLLERLQQNQGVLKVLLGWIKASKEKVGIEKAAANAITLLVKAGVYFNRLDLSQVKVPGADLSYGLFDHTRFQDADLKGVNWTGAWLRGVNLNGANLADLELGERPILKTENWINTCCYSPDGRWLATSEGQDIRLYKAECLQKIHTYIGHKGEVNNVAFSPDSQWLASGGNDNTVMLWGVSGDRSFTHTYTGHNSKVASVAFSANGQWLASGSKDKMVKLWNILDDKFLAHTYVGHEDDVKSVAFSPDSQWLASGSGDNTIKLWTTSGSGQLIYTYTGHTKPVNSVAFSPNGQWLASGSEDKTVKLWDVLGKHTLLHTYNGHNGDVMNVAFSPEGEWLASGSKDKSVKLWRVIGERFLIHTYTGQSETVTSVAFSPGGRWLASSGGWGIKLWSVSGVRHTHAGHEGEVNSVAFSADGHWLASGSEDKTVKLWSISDNKSLAHTYVGHKRREKSVAFSPDGQWLASGGWDRAIRLWNILGDQSLAHTYMHIGLEDLSVIKSIVFSPNSQWLASASYYNTVHLWNVSGDRSLVHTYIGHIGSVNSVAFSPDGQWLASGSKDKMVRLWNILDDKFLAHTYVGHEDDVRSVAFSPDSQWLASGSGDNTIKLWTTSGSGQLIYTYTGHTKPVNSVAFSPNGQWLASGSNDETVRLWPVLIDEFQIMLQSIASSSRKKRLLSFVDHGLHGVLLGLVDIVDRQVILKNFTGPVHAVAWQPNNGAILSTAGADGTLRLWRVSYGLSQIYTVTLDWASKQDKLTARGSSIINARNLSARNRDLLMQHDAVGSHFRRVKKLN